MSLTKSQQLLYRSYKELRFKGYSAFDTAKLLSRKQRQTIHAIFNQLLNILNNISKNDIQ